MVAEPDWLSVTVSYRIPDLLFVQSSWSHDHPLLLFLWNYKEEVDILPHLFLSLMNVTPRKLNYDFHYLFMTSVFKFHILNWHCLFDMTYYLIICSLLNVIWESVEPGCLLSNILLTNLKLSPKTQYIVFHMLHRSFHYLRKHTFIA